MPWGFGGQAWSSQRRAGRVIVFGHFLNDHFRSSSGVVGVTMGQRRGGLSCKTEPRPPDSNLCLRVFCGWLIVVLR